ATVTPGGAISGTVFFDANDDSVFEPNPAIGEVGIPDARVFLDTNGNHMFDANEVFTWTDSNGFYSFDNLGSGLGSFSTYAVTVDLTSSPLLGLNATTPTFDIVSLASGQHVTNVNFGFFNAPPPPT